MTIINNSDKEEADEYTKLSPSSERSQLLGTEPGAPDRERDLPPRFQPYHADHEVTPSGDTYTHDRHLNEDGEALHQFLVSQAKFPPKFLLNCRGTHPEARVQHITKTETTDGRTVTVTEPQTHTETIIDFEFTIDLSHYLHQFPSVIWTVPDDDPTYRGGMSPEVSTGNASGVRVPERILKAWQAWRETRGKWGLPPWLSIADQSDIVRRVTPAEESNPTRSEFTLRQWADRYCTSDKALKSFKFRKVIYGWNIDTLTQAVRVVIQRASQVRSPTIAVEFMTSASEIEIRSSSVLAQALSKSWVVALLWILLVYPFILLYNRFRGGRWEVAGAAFPLQSWKHCEDSIPGELVDSYLRRTAQEVTAGGSDLNSRGTRGAFDRVLKETPSGISELFGTTGRDWLLTWESTIIHCVTSQVREPIPITTPYGMQTATLLDDLRPPILNRFTSSRQDPQQ